MAGLTSKMKKLAEIMCVEPSLKQDEYAERVGISVKTVYVYRQKPEFQEYLSELCKERFKAMESLAIQKLHEEINKNNFKAIQYALDGLGYKAKEEQQIQMDAKIEIDYGED